MPSEVAPNELIRQASVRRALLSLANDSCGERSHPLTRRFPRAHRGSGDGPGICVLKTCSNSSRALGKGRARATVKNSTPVTEEVPLTCFSSVALRRLIIPPFLASGGRTRSVLSMVLFQPPRELNDPNRECQAFPWFRSEKRSLFPIPLLS